MGKNVNQTTRRAHKFENSLQGIRSEIENYLAECTNASYPANLYEPIKYFLELGGKRIRPALTLLACKAVSGKYQEALPAAAAIELLHNFTLVHDDIMDQDSLRRGKATVHTRWSEAAAILTGDGLIGLAYRTLLKTPVNTLQEVLKIFTEGVIRVCEGQAIDKEFEDREQVSLEEYFDMIQKKTGKLITICAEIGGIIGGGSPEKIQALTGFGASMGRAFQLQDDMLDITSTESVLGKDLGSDLAQGKKTYAIVKLKARSSQEDWSFVQRVFESRRIDRDTLGRIRKILDKYGIIQDAEKQIKADIERARGFLFAVETGEWAADLLDFSQIILNRKH